MKTVVVTGATGFLGRRTVKWLTDSGYSVTATGRDRAIGAALEREGAKFRSMSLDFEPRDPARRRELEELLAGQDAVVHCAALAAPWGRLERFERANVLATENLLAALDRLPDEGRGPRLVHVSTPSIYVDSRAREGIRESDPLPARPANAYSATKLKAEALVAEAAREGLETVVLRPQGIFGPGDPHIFPRILKLADRGAVPLVDGGRSRIDLTYVDNVAHAIELAIRAPARALGNAYNITNGAPVEIGAAILDLLGRVGIPARVRKVPLPVALAVAKALEAFHRAFRPEVEPALTVYSVYSLGLSRTLSIDAARADLGYAPLVGIEEAFRRTAEAFRAARARETGRGRP